MRLNPYSQRGATVCYTFVLAVLWVVFGIELTLGGSARTAQAVQADQAVEVLEHHEALSHGVAPDDITREFAWLEKSHDARVDNTAIEHPQKLTLE